MRYARKRRGPTASAAAAAANAGFVPVPVDAGGGGEVVEEFSHSGTGGGAYLILTDNPTWWRHPLDTRTLASHPSPFPLCCSPSRVPASVLRLFGVK